MLNKNMLRRTYLIIRRIMKNDFPTKNAILEYLRIHDIDIDMRTMERDLNTIRYNLDVEIKYDSKDKRGYYIDMDLSDDFDKLLYFIGLAENADVILDSLRDKQSLWKYVAISPAATFKGIEQLSTLLQAIRNRNVVNFNHLNYNTGNQTAYQAEPYLLKEFEGRWYLYAFVIEIKEFRTFGLDRISDLEVTGTQFQRTKQKELAAERFNDVYGLTYMPNDEETGKETVSIRCNSDFMVGHFSSLPLHYSQKIEDKVVSLRVIINLELENKLLSYGEQVEVLVPEGLRGRMKERLKNAVKQYQK